MTARSVILVVGVALTLLLASFSGQEVQAHPLRLSLCEIEYDAEDALLTISLRLFLMDVNEALLFDPDNDELALGRPDELPHAERLLLAYLNQFFSVSANGEKVALDILDKRLSGDGDNVALALLFEKRQAPPLTSLDIMNTVFTDLFFDQNNIVYVHVGDESKSLMFSKKTPTQTLVF